MNANAKAILEEKHQRDLQRQTVQLAKIVASFNDQLAKSRAHVQQTFAQLRSVLAERESHVERQLAQAGAQGVALLKDRQFRAADLRLMADNVQHLNDQEALELRQDIKHFVSERQLDEEFASLKLVTFDSLNEVSLIYI